MKNIIIRNAKIIDPQSKYHGQKKDILIQDGIIQKIDLKIQLNTPYLEIKIKNLHVSPGWVDLHTRLCEPGFEYRETIETGLQAAAKGGFTSVVMMSSTNPPIEKKSDIIFLLKKATNNIVDILPTGCITKSHTQNEITEMYDMHQNGAIAFTNDKTPIQNAMLMNIALEYVKNFNGLIMTTCLDADLNRFAQINESEISTKMGLNPSPELAENLIVMRDLKLLDYTQSRLHISTISTKTSLDQIKKAKKDKLQISTDVAAHQLILNEEAIQTFDTNLKVMPPLRSEKTRKALIDGIINGTIDAISSDHSPIEIESKKCEFQTAKFGIIGLETVFPIINTILKDYLQVDQIVDLISKNPRNILKLEQPIIAEKKEANITLFDPSKEWIYTKEEIQSISKNTPFINYKFTGKSLGVINNGKIQIDN